jgi:uncharacterized protein (TIGR02722 family)
MKLITIGAIIFTTLVFTGCATKPQYVKTVDAPITMGLDRRDFEKAAEAAVKDLLDSGAMDRKGGGRYVVTMGRMINDTTQRIDTDMLTKKIRISLLKSGKAVMTTAVSVDGPEDEMTKEVRKLRDDDEFKQSTIAKKGTIYSPDMSLSGKIIQRTVKANSDDQLVEYYFQLTMTQLETGLAFWEGETTIGKLGSNDSVTW